MSAWNIFCFKPSAHDVVLLMELCPWIPAGYQLSNMCFCIVGWACQWRQCKWRIQFEWRKQQHQHQHLQPGDSTLLLVFGSGGTRSEMDACSRFHQQSCNTERKLLGDSLMEHFAKHYIQAWFKRSYTVVTNNVMESSFSKSLQQMACLHPWILW